MNGAAIQQKIYYGYSLAASRLGVPYSWYRPPGPNNPLSGANLVSPLSFNYTSSILTLSGSPIYGQQVSVSLGAASVSYTILPSDTLVSVVTALGLLLAQAGFANTVSGAAITFTTAPSAYVMGSCYLMASMTPNFQYSTFVGFGKFAYNCLANGSVLQVGDYLVGANRIFYVAALQELLPIFAVETNDTLNVLRFQTTGLVGALSYGGIEGDKMTILAAAWPASVLKATRFDPSPTRLPSDSKISHMQVLMPAIPGTPLFYGDILQDSDGNNYMIDMMELTELGYRLDCVAEVA